MFITPIINVRYVTLAINASVFLDPLCYGYYLDDNEKMVSDIFSELPVDFPLPSTCQKCVRDSICPFRVKSIGCFQYCKCVETAFKNSATVVVR